VDTLPFVFRHAWLLFVIVTCANGTVWWLRARPKIAENPALREGYRRLIYESEMALFFECMPLCA
jgi:hypothetical protein